MSFGLPYEAPSHQVSTEQNCFASREASHTMGNTIFQSITLLQVSLRFLILSLLKFWAAPPKVILLEIDCLTVRESICRWKHIFYK